MRTDGEARSDNVEDRRGGGGRLVGGGIGALVVGLVAWFVTGDPGALLQGIEQGSQQAGPPTAEENRLADFSSVVLASTEEVWTQLLPRMGKPYVKPKLVLFSRGVDSACGQATSAVGPFYCPGDSKLYLDLGFFVELSQKYKAPGDFAQAYVIAHEVGHHVQNLLGRSEWLDRQRDRVSKSAYNKLSVRLELQADFYAGVWAHHAEKLRKVLEPGDLDEALRAANAIGDDTLQRNSRGSVVPDSFTHGTSAQRIAWFRHGFTTGDPAAGDTFDDAVFERVNPR